VLGLLALIIAFISMAVARFEARRDAVLNEANAIGTTALRARLLPEPHRTESLKLLREIRENTARHRRESGVSDGIGGCERSIKRAPRGALAAGKGNVREG